MMTLAKRFDTLKIKVNKLFSIFRSGVLFALFLYISSFSINLLTFYQQRALGAFFFVCVVSVKKI